MTFVMRSTTFSLAVPSICMVSYLISCRMRVMCIRQSSHVRCETHTLYSIVFWITGFQDLPAMAGSQPNTGIHRSCVRPSCIHLPHLRCCHPGNPPCCRLPLGQGPDTTDGL